MTRKKMNVNPTASFVDKLVCTEYPDYLIVAKNAFYNTLCRINIKSNNGQPITAKKHFDEMYKRLHAESGNVLEHLSKIHPILWVTHSIGEWKNDYWISNPSTTLKNIQDEWFKECRTKNIFRMGEGMGEYKWDQFKNVWDLLFRSNNDKDMSPEDIINHFRASLIDIKRIEKEEQQRLHDQMQANIEKAREEGRKRQEQIEAEKKRQKEEEEARLERERKAKEEAERRAIEEEAKRQLEREREEQKKAEEEAEWQRMLEEEEAEKKDEAPVEDEESMFEEQNLFETADAIDFLKPRYRMPTGNEVRILSDEGTFYFGTASSKEVLDAGFDCVHIVPDNIGGFYFVFDKVPGIRMQSTVTGGKIRVNTKKGSAQFLTMLNVGGKCAYAALSKNVSINKNKVAFHIDSITVE